MGLRVIDSGSLRSLFLVLSAAASAIAQSPTITTQPESQIVRNGATVRFSVLAEGSLPLSYQWRFNDLDLPNATNATLVLTNVQPSAGGRYSVIVSNSEDSTSSVEAVLSVCWRVQRASALRQRDTTLALGVYQIRVDSEGNWYQIRYLDWNVPGKGFACAKLDRQGNLLWEASYGATNGLHVFPSDLALDATGAVYVSVTASTNFVGDKVDLIVLRFDSGGNKSWSARFKSAGFNHRIVSDEAGNILVTGINSAGSVNEAAIPIKSSAVALTKLDPAGQGAWCTKTNVVSQPGQPGLDRNSLAFGPNGSIFATELISHQFSQDEPYGTEFVTARLSADGVELWRARYGYVNLTQPYSLLVDLEGNSFVTGSIFHGAPVDDHFTLKYSPDGRLLWVAWWPNQSESGVLGTAALDDSGNLFIALPLPKWRPPPTESSVTAKFDPDGNRLWTVSESAPDGEGFRPMQLRIDAAGSVFASGLYFVSSNDFGRMTVEYAQNTTPGLPVIRQEPPDRRVRAGQTVVLSVFATGAGGLRYQWRFNGANLAGATNALLVLSNIRTNQTGAYSALATNVAGCALSSDANLTVVEIPPFSLDHPVVTNQWAAIRMFGGETGRLYFIETSTNLVDWREEVGQGADGQGSALFLFRRDRAQQYFRATTSP